jgi:type I restriction enzyme S subunit
VSYRLLSAGSRYFTQNSQQVVGMASISQPQVARFPVPLPPLPEQRRIVAEIEKQFTRLEAAVAALRRVQANLKRYRAAVLKAACEEDWPRKPLGEIAEVKLGKMLDKAKHVRGRKLPYLRNVNVRWGKTDTEDLREMYFEDDQLERYGLKVGDVLVCEGGEPGRAAVWTGLLPEMKYQKALHRVRFNVPYDPRLLVWLLERLAMTGGIERRFTGSTIKHFTREAFVELPVPVPPLAEQTRIVAEVERRLSVVEELEAVVRASLQRAVRLRQSILQKAFTGQL